LSTRVIINGIQITAEEGKTILEVCRKAGIRIPTLCHDERLEPYGGCRLCLVEIKGSKTSTRRRSKHTKSCLRKSSSILQRWQ
jgi:NADH dehydrogenase/NADH:ubiquinone oxidoreductase subunit G